jgi:acyl-CoA synthetase (AMP-forming)/AMP-acid ligase II
VGEAVDRAAERWPDREALVFEGLRWTWSDLSARVGVTARWLAERDIRRGDRLIWQLPNGLEGVIVHLAAWRIGAVAIPVVPIYREHEMRHILAETRPAAVVFASRAGSRSPALEMEPLVVGAPNSPRLRVAVGPRIPGWDSFHDVRADPDLSEIEPPSVADPRECCLALYTSGTTAAPKGARHSSESLMAAVRLWQRRFDLGVDDCFIMGAPITHIAGLLLALVVPAVCGARTVLMPGWDADEAVRLCEAERVTFCAGATVFLQDLVERYEAGAAPRHRLPRFMCGGAAVPPSIIERADSVGVKAWRCWGMTEAPTATLADPSDPLEKRAYFDGRPTDGCEIEAVDGQRQRLPVGEIGELRLRAPQQMLGYIDREVHAAQTDAEGWFYTGDVGRLAEDGWLTMTGRVKDIINRGGEKFSSQDIEYAIASHPCIQRVAVVGVPEARLGEAVAAFVVVNPGADWPGVDALVDHLERQRVARQKIPVHWRQLEELPATPSGKVQKHRLLELWEAGLSNGGRPGSAFM